MNRLFTKVNFLLVFLVFSFLPHAQASSWFGVRTGSPLNLTVHYGFDLFANVDLRIGANVKQRQAFLDYYNGNKSPNSFGIGLDGLFNLTEAHPLGIYLGAGANLNFIDAKTISDLHLLAGLEFSPSIPVLDHIGIFTEASAGLGSVNISEKFFQELTWSVGLNIHLP